MKKSNIFLIITILTILVGGSSAKSDSESYTFLNEFDAAHPFADFNFSVNGRYVIFNASPSFDSDGTIIEYRWDFGDFTTFIGKIVNHTYATCGIYNVELSIQDNDGFFNSISKNVTIIDFEKPQIYNENVNPRIQQTGGYVNLSAYFEDNDELRDVGVIIQYPDNSKENLSILYNNTGDCYYCNKTYDFVGRYTFRFWAVDMCGNSAKSNLIIIFHINHGLIAEAHGPYIGFKNKPIQFSGSVIGGNPPYTYYWDFGDGGESTIKNPTHVYLNEGTYTALLTIKDKAGFESIDIATVTIKTPDYTSPVVKITQPENGIYVRNNKISGFSSTIVFGFIEIESIAIDEESGVANLELYIDGQLMENFTGESFNWTWFEMSFSMHVLKVKAHDNGGNTAVDEKLLWKFF
jgi:PKD repeat protein